MTYSDLKSIVDEIQYRNWRFILDVDDSNLYVRVGFDADGQSWTGRKWIISSHATRSEVVQTCLLAVLTAEEHEAREHFLYRGEAVFSPHLDILTRLSFDAR